MIIIISKGQRNHWTNWVKKIPSIPNDLAMINLNVYSLCLALTLFFAYTSNGQIEVPPLSTRCEIKQKVGFTEVLIDYSRPSMRQRVIFGELVPFNKVWRTGANEATTISFSEDVRLNGEFVPSGKYTLLTIPREDRWVIILNTDTSLVGTRGYVSDRDIIRFDVESEKIHEHYETFTIDLGELTQSTANIRLIWENTLVKFLLGTQADQEVMKQIEANLKNPMAKMSQMYFTAANYYFNTHRDMQQALEWVDECINIGGEQYWVLRLKSQILAEQEDWKGAIRVAKRSLTLAEEAGSEEYMEMNRQSIRKWQNIEPH